MINSIGVDTGYEKIDHVVLKFGVRFSKVKSCKADAEIEMNLLSSSSIYSPEFFSVSSEIDFIGGRND